MRRRTFLFALSASLGSASACANTSDAPRAPTAGWTYAEASSWGTTVPGAHACGGADQSPVDLSADVPSTSEPLLFANYGATPVDIRFDGHTVKASTATRFGATDPRLTYRGATYHLVELHFHAPSEHRIGGVGRDMELHLVHKTSPALDADTAVVGLLLRVGGPHGALQRMLTAVSLAGTTERDDSSIELSALLPADRSYFAYAPGSLTTPPCTVGVQWIVMPSGGTIAADQRDAFMDLTHGATNRPVQPLGRRQIVHHRASGRP